MGKLGQTLKAFWVFVVAILVQVLGSVIFGTIYGMVIGVRIAKEGITDPEAVSVRLTRALAESNFYIISLAVVTCLEVIVFGIWYYKKYGRIKQEVTYKEIFSLQNIVVLLVATLAAHFSITFVLNTVLSRFPELAEQYSKVISPLVNGNTVAVVIVSSIAAPIGEECIFRGLILRKLNRVWGAFGAIFIQALLFGALHFNFVQGVYAFLFGVLLGYISLKLHSVIPAIIVHMVFNLMGVLIDPIIPDTVLDSSWVVALVIIGGAVLTVYMLRRLKGIERVQGEVQEEVAIVDNPEDSL